MNQEVNLPEKFKIAGQEILVQIEESLPDNDYGYFDDAANIIKLARTVNTEYNGDIRLTNSQIRNTFYHELFHVFQFYFDNEFLEAQAQVYANFMCEFLESNK